MNTAQSVAEMPSVARRQRPALRRLGADVWLYLGITALVAGAYALSHMGLYDARSDVGYWTGVAGGVMMLLLFAYPLRKRSALLSRWGKAKHWFVVHMILGVGGPVLVLAHSAFRIGSVNAGVALISMLVVAASGVAGRFIYLRVHRDLGGEVETLASLKLTMGEEDPKVRGALHYAPEAATRLQDLQRHAGVPRDSWLEHGYRICILPWVLRKERRAIRQMTKKSMRRVGRQRNWDVQTLRAREKRALQMVDDYTGAVLRVAQLAAYSRLFSLWHVLHVPFVFLMVLCAIAHVVAVHAY